MRNDMSQASPRERRRQLLVVLFRCQQDGCVNTVLVPGGSCPFHQDAESGQS